MILSVTPTKLQDYLICPLKFKFRHLDKTGGITSSAAFSFGTSMHRALQKLHSAGNIRPQNEDTVKLLERFWEKSAYPTKNEEQEYFSKGCRALENYVAEMRGLNEETLGTEVYMSLVLELKRTKLRLGCKVDRLALHPDQTLEIIDYKTNRSGKVPTAESLVRDLPAFLYYSDETDLSAISEHQTELPECVDDGEGVGQIRKSDCR